MTLADFNAQFDLYYNNIASNQAPGLNAYEKSVFLTDAQNEWTLNLYNGKNPLGESFEQTEELRRYLSDLVLEAILSPYTAEEATMPTKIDANSTLFKLPQNTNTNKYKKVWFIVYENVLLKKDDANGCLSGKTMDVVPTRYDEYAKVRKNPFRGANNRRALRFDYSKDFVEIVCNYKVDKYYIRYLRKPKPIILEDLEEGLSIDGENTAMNCELPDSLHKVILMRAVELAIQSWNRQ